MPPDQQQPEYRERTNTTVYEGADYSAWSSDHNYSGHEVGVPEVQYRFCYTDNGIPDVNVPAPEIQYQFCYTDNGISDVNVPAPEIQY